MNINRNEGKTMKNLYIFTDGGSYNNGKKDKYKPEVSASGGIIVFHDKIIKEYYSIKENENINYGELNAIYELLEISFRLISQNDLLQNVSSITVIGDNQYTIKGLQEWMYNWMKNAPDGNWRNSNGVEIVKKDQILFQDIYIKFIRPEKYKINFYHIKGHSNPNNQKELDSLTKKFCKVNKINISQESLRKVVIYNNYVDDKVRTYLDKYIIKRDKKPFILI